MTKKTHRITDDTLDFGGDLYSALLVARAERDAALALAERRAAERDRLREAGMGLLASWSGWEHIWMEMMKGYITDEEYAALQRLGALCGLPDPRLAAASGEGE